MNAIILHQFTDRWLVVVAIATIACLVYACLTVDDGEETDCYHHVVVPPKESSNSSVGELYRACRRTGLPWWCSARIALQTWFKQRSK